MDVARTEEWWVLQAAISSRKTKATHRQLLAHHTSRCCQVAHEGGFVETLKDVGLESPDIDANGKYTFSVQFRRLFEDLPVSGDLPKALEYRSIAFDDKKAGQETLGQDVWFTLVRFWFTFDSLLVQSWLILVHLESESK